MSARPPSLIHSIAAALMLGAPAGLAAQEAPRTFQLPPPSPTPTPAPAGPADERAGVAIPPRPLPTAAVTPSPSPVPGEAERVSPELAPGAEERPPSPTAAPAAAAAAARPRALPTNATLPSDPAAPAALPSAVSPSLGAPDRDLPSGPAPETAPLAPARSALPNWWPLAAAGLGASVLAIAAALARRRRKTRPLRLAAPVPAAAAAAAAAAPPEPPRLDLTLEIVSATRSVMMFTLEYRLTLANRSERALREVAVAAHLAPAQRGAPAGVPPGLAQSLATLPWIGPHQAKTLTGRVQLPLGAIPTLGGAARGLFVPLVHLTIAAAQHASLARSFVVGPPSGNGRLHPVALDRAPGAIPGLVAQAVAIPAIPAAA